MSCIALPRLRPTAWAISLHCALLCLTANVARAQEAPAAQAANNEGGSLPTLEVKARGEKPGERKVTSGAKTDTPLKDIPQSISVVGRDELDRRQVGSLQEALRYVPGVTAERAGPDPRGVDFFLLRGFTSDAGGVVRDGLRQGSFADLTFITESYGLEAVEVLRGPSSMLFGASDAGGLVNLVSKRPTGTTSREVELQLGSYNRRQVGVDLEGLLNADGTLQYRIVGTSLRSGTQLQYPTGERPLHARLYVAPSLKWMIAPSTSLTFYSEVMRDHAPDDIEFRDLANGQPTNVLEGEPDFSRIKRNTDSVGYQLEHRFTDGLMLRQHLRRSHGEGLKKHFWAWLDTPPSIYKRQAGLGDHQLDQTQIDTQLHAKFSLGGMQHKALVGLDWNHLKAWQKTIASDPDGGMELDLLDPVYGQPLMPLSYLDSHEKVSLRQLGIYVQDEIALDSQWMLSLGGRWDNAHIDHVNLASPKETRPHDKVFSGRAALSYKVSEEVTSYVSYAESFLPLTESGPDGSLFKPSEGKSKELGLKYQRAGAPFFIAASVFDMKKTNVPTISPLGTRVQQGEVQSRGLELEFKGSLSSRLLATASYTYANVEVTRDANPSLIGKTPIQVPRQTANVFMEYKIPVSDASRVNLLAGARHVAQRFDTNDNMKHQGAYTLLDLGASYEAGPWRISFNVDNALDKKYFQSRADNRTYPGAERTYKASVKYLW